MDRTTLAVLGLLGVAVLLLLGSLLIFGSGFYRATVRRRRVQRARHARILVTAALGRGDERSAVHALSQLTPRERIRSFAELAPALRGDARERLARVGAAVGLHDLARRMTGSPLWWRRLSGVRLAILLHERMLVRLRLDDSHATVRAQAAASAPDSPNADLVLGLISLMNDRDDLVRVVARDSLIRVGPLANGPLAAHLTHVQGAQALPALQVATALGDPSFSRFADRFLHDPLADNRAQAARLLGAVGSADRAPVLVTLLDDPNEDVRAAAAHALGRLRYEAAGNALAERLEDSAWSVRREAALALRSLGEPGARLLHHIVDAGGTFASDMARQVLDLPASSAAFARRA